MTFDRPNSPIAIVGAACRFPQADGLTAFWNVLERGLDVVTEVPAGRWAKDFYFHPSQGQAGKSYTWSAGVLDDIAGFDCGFFGISPREAEQIDPQQRLLLELAWEALEDAGVRAGQLSGEPVGVYVGFSGAEYANIRMGDPSAGDAYFMTGTAGGIVANRLSYVLDLHGPSVVVDTACSSSLVALHMACEAIRRGEIPAALVGGVNLLLSPYPFIGFCQASMLSPAGRCFAFDARANGYVRGEGGGVVLLKPLAAALADGDRVHAVILGDGVNSDGRTIGMSMPSQQAQADLLRKVYSAAGVSAEDLTFIEAHGTGTQAGDPIELSALGEVLGRARATPLPIGSVKTNIGHLETASGMAGLIKTMLALERRRLPPSLHFERPNPHIPFAELNVEIAAEGRVLANGKTRLVAGVNSFGFGGTNAHAVLCSAPPTARPVAETRHGLPPLLLSARSEAALRGLAATWSETLRKVGDEAASALVRGAARKRDHHRHRLAAWGKGSLEIAQALASEASPRRVQGVAAGTGGVVFAFSGNGAQWVGMGRVAMAQSAVFARALEEVDAHLQPLLGWSVVEQLKTADVAALAGTDVAQPLLFAVQVGVVRALAAEGVEPSACVGHSVGEIAAAWAAGALSLEDACRVVVARSREQERTRGAGRMAALNLPEAQASEVLERLGLRLEVAAVNSSSAVTVAGDEQDLERLAAEAAAKGWRLVKLDLDYAFHSAALDGIRESLVEALEGITPQIPRRTLVSTVTGDPVEQPALDADYWWRNVRHPVQFKVALDRLIAGGHRLFVEVGPSPILQSYIRDQLRANGVQGRAMATLSQRGKDRDPFLALAAEIHVCGYDLSQHSLFDGPARVDGLPHYPWQREDFWVQPTSETIPLANPRGDAPLLGVTWDAEGDAWKSIIDVERLPWLADHALEGVPVLPAAAMAEMALEAARARLGDGRTLEVADLDILRAMAFEPGRSREVRVRVGADQRLLIESRARLGEEPWTFHGSAQLRVSDAMAVQTPSAFEVKKVVSGAAIYARAEALGLNYGPTFRTVETVELSLCGRQARVRFRADSIASAAAGHVLWPPLLDGALQGLFAMIEEAAGELGATLLPSRFGRVRAYAPHDQAPVEARLTLKRRGRRSACVDIDLLNEQGRIVTALRDCWFAAAQLKRSASIDERSYRFALTPARPHRGTHSPASEQLGARLSALADATSDAQDSALLFGAYMAARAHAAVAAFGPPDAIIDHSKLANAGAAAPLFARTLAFLAEHGLAEETVVGWRLEPTCELGPPDLIWRTVLADRPDLVSDIAVATQTVAALAQKFRSGAEADAKDASILEQVLGGKGFQAAVEMLAEEVSALLLAWPSSRPCRVLEIGAGNGALAQAVMKKLGRWPEHLSYLATEADPHQAPRLAAGLSEHREIQTLCWSPEEGQPLGGSFDLVIGAWGLSRLSHPESSLARLHEVLNEGGAVLIAEPAPNFCLDVTLGQDATWWRGSVSPEFPMSPLRTAEEWRAAADGARLSPLPTWPVDTGLWRTNLLGFARAPGRAGGAEQAPAPRLSIVSTHEHQLQAALDKVRVSRPSETANPTTTPDVDEMSVNVVILAQARANDDALDAVAEHLSLAVDTALKLASSYPSARLWIVTQGAHLDGADPGATALGGALWALGRTLANEAPEVECRLIDLDPAFGADEAAAVLWDELHDVDAEREVVLTPQGRWALRLVDGLPQHRGLAGEVELGVERPGLLDSLSWRGSTAAGAPGPGEVAIEVHASGVNFRDVMWAQGLLPEEALQDGFAGPTLGLECAGVISAVGEGVADLTIGQRVMAFAPAALSSRVVTSAHAVTLLPDALSFEAGATIPVAYLTAGYALGTLAGLSAGERVLIHGAAGGVGLAAVQYAKHRGAIVYATAGSPAKREFLRQFGADVVLDSRSLSFADEIDRLTNGDGVDVVLNSLSGEAMERSLELLRPFGRFLELGKRDFYFGGRVGLRPFRQNITYFAVDVDQLPARRPRVCAAVLAEVLDLMEAGALTPLPHRSFGADQVVDAFRLMQSSGHIGKLVITPDRRPRDADDLSVRRAFTVRGDATYLIAGGLLGFGLETARWLLEQGARHFALLGRRGLHTPGAAAAIGLLEAAGASVRVIGCDIADGDALAAVLQEVRLTMPPIRGVVNAAMTVDDGLLSDLTVERFRSVLAPKLAGTRNLDRLLQADRLDFVLLYSSATTVLGAPGQGSYVAANAAMEALARNMHARGTPVLAIAWGPIADAGYLARQELALDALARRLAATPIPAREALEAIPDLWASGEPVLTYAAVQWFSARRSLPILRTPVFARFADEIAEATDADVRDRIAGLNPAEASELITGVLVEEIARIIGAATDRVDPHRPLSELGVDSLMAVELRLAIETRLGLNLPLLSLADSTSLSNIAARISRTLQGEAASPDSVIEATARHESSSVLAPTDAPPLQDERPLISAAE